MSLSWHSYPKIYNIGHKYLSQLFWDEVIVQEKVDGSQFSFGMIPSVDENGNVFNELRFRSKGQEFSAESVNGMFALGVEAVLRAKDKLVPGRTYRGEYLMKPKHNVLAYDRAPENNVILFDINDGEESYLPYAEVKAEGARLGFEVVPLLFEGKITSHIDLEKLLEKTSVLGGQKIEGFVVKNYARYGIDKKALMGKFVSESFKEVHAKEWGEGNPKQGDILVRLIERYRTPARWQKAIIHLKEKGLLEGTPRDIGLIVKEVPTDLLSECGEEIMKELFLWAKDHILRGVNRGLAQHYKEMLAKEQRFAPTPEADASTAPEGYTRREQDQSPGDDV